MSPTTISCSQPKSLLSASLKSNLQILIHPSPPSLHPAIAKLSTQAFVQNAMDAYLFPHRIRHPTAYYKAYLSIIGRAAEGVGKEVIVAEIDGSTAKGGGGNGKEREVVGFFIFSRCGFEDDETREKKTGWRKFFPKTLSFFISTLHSTILLTLLNPSTSLLHNLKFYLLPHPPLYFTLTPTPTLTSSATISPLPPPKGQDSDESVSPAIQEQGQKQKYGIRRKSVECISSRIHLRRFIFHFPKHRLSHATPPSASKIYTPPTRYYHISELAVLPRLQGQGIGAAMVAWVLERAGKDGVPVTLAATKEGRKLYEKFGFRVVGRWCWGSGFGRGKGGGEEGTYVFMRWDPDRNEKGSREGKLIER